MGLNGYNTARTAESNKTLNGVASLAYFRRIDATFG